MNSQSSMLCLIPALSLSKSSNSWENFIGIFATQFTFIFEKTILSSLRASKRPMKKNKLSKNKESRPKKSKKIQKNLNASNNDEFVP